MNNCPNCNHDLVNIIYGMPSSKAIDLARQEDIALGGCNFELGLPTHYCYGCHEAYPTIEEKGSYDEVPSPLFSE
jgi:hypothetical protein